MGWTVLMIVSEPLTNAGRHAFEGPGGLVSVEVSGQDDDIICTVSDDGVGMTAPSHGLHSGSVIVAELAKGARIGLTTHGLSEGTLVELRLPVAVD